MLERRGLGTGLGGEGEGKEGEGEGAPRGPQLLAGYREVSERTQGAPVGAPWASGVLSV